MQEYKCCCQSLDIKNMTTSVFGNFACAAELGWRSGDAASGAQMDWIRTLPVLDSHCQSWIWCIFKQGGNYKNCKKWKKYGGQQMWRNPSHWLFLLQFCLTIQSSMLIWLFIALLGRKATKQLWVLSVSALLFQQWSRPVTLIQIIWQCSKNAFKINQQGRPTKPI